MTSSSQSEDWQLNKSVIECNVEMLEQRLCTDVTFILATPPTVEEIPTKKKNGRKSKQDLAVAKQGAQLGAHTYVLASRSPVFMIMFHGPLAERSGTVHVEDCDNEAAFMQFLRFLYSDTVELTIETAMDVLYLARKYMVPALEVLCNRFIQQHLDVENVCLLAAHALRISEDDVLQMCLTFIRANQADVFRSPEFVDIPREFFECVLEEKYMTVSEEDILDACIRWAKWQYKLTHKGEPSGAEVREILGPCLHKVPFNGLEAKTFTVKAVDSGLLTPEIALQFYRRFSFGETKDAPPVPKPFAGSKISFMVPCSFDLPTPKTYSDFKYHDKLYAPNDHVMDSGNIDFCFMNARKKVINSLVMYFDLRLGKNAESFRFDFESECVSIKGVPCCERIKYSAVERNSSDFIRVELFLTPVEFTSQCQVTLKLSSKDMFRMIAPASSDAKQENKMYIKWAKFQNRVPFYSVKYLVQRV